MKHQQLLIATILDCLYLYYMFNVFQTKFEINHPFEALFTQSLDVLRHPIGTGEYESKICPMGSMLSYVLIGLIALRYLVIARIVPVPTYVIKYYLPVVNRYFAMAVWLMAFFFNMNAFLYLMPVFVAEIFYFIPQYSIHV